MIARQLGQLVWGDRFTFNLLWQNCWLKNPTFILVSTDHLSTCQGGILDVIYSTQCVLTDERLKYTHVRRGRPQPTQKKHIVCSALASSRRMNQYYRSQALMLMNDILIFWTSIKPFKGKKRDFAVPVLWKWFWRVLTSSSPLYSSFSLSK